MKRYYLILFLFFVSLIKSEAGAIKTNQEIISLIENNWNSISTMSGTFKQIDPDNNIDTGNFYFDKPYKSKFLYDKKKESIITSRFLIHLLDQEGFQIDSYPIGNSPIKKILSKSITFDEIFKITGFSEETDLYQMTVTSKTPNNLNEKVLFFFTKEDLTLKKWQISDEFNNKTVLEFTNIQKNIFIQPNKFVVRYKE